MPIPLTFDELVTTGYRYSGQSFCKGCGKRIEWWTTPKKRPISLDLMIDPDSPVTPHFDTCTYVAQLRAEQLRKSKLSNKRESAMTPE
jgi:hypothetical protein